MSEKIKNFYLLTSIIIAIFVGTFLWDKINFAPPQHIIENYPLSKYVQKNFYHLNELIRYCVFIFLPSFTYLCFLVINKKFYLPLFRKETPSKETLNQNKGSDLILFFLIILIFLSYFYFYKFPRLGGAGFWDGLHYGQYLTSGENYFHYKTLWKNSFITMGFGYEFLIPILSQKIFNSNSIAHIFSIRIFLTVISQLIFIFSHIDLALIKKLPKI